MKPEAERKPRKGVRVLLALVVLVITGIAIAQTQLADSPAAARHVAAAKMLAGDDLTAVAEGYLCRSPVGAGAYLSPYLVTLLAGTDKVQTFQAFADLYYIGLKFVGTWVLVTSDGLILFDAMFNEQQAKEVVVAGLEQLGLDPKDLKHIIITHAHGDHDGGADYLQREYGARVWLSAIDWDYLEEHRNDPPMKPFGDMWPDSLPQRDAVAEDGGVLEFGGKTVQFVVTPGHTPGTLSAVISVDDGGIRRFITLWGGTAMPQGSEAVLGMHASLLKLWRAGQDAGAEGVISTHAFVEDSFGRAELERTDGRNPFNLGKDGFNRMLAIHSECILAQAARYQASGE